MRYFPQISYDRALYEFPMARGWALIAHARLNDAWAGLTLNSPGYIGQELDRITP